VVLTGRRRRGGRGPAAVVGPATCHVG